MYKIDIKFCCEMGEVFLNMLHSVVLGKLKTFFYVTYESWCGFVIIFFKVSQLIA